MTPPLYNSCSGTFLLFSICWPSPAFQWSSFIVQTGFPIEKEVTWGVPMEVRRPVAAKRPAVAYCMICRCILFNFFFLGWTKWPHSLRPTFNLLFFWKPQSNLRWRTNRKKENVFLAKHYEQIADFVLWKIVHRRVFLLRWRYWVQANQVESTSRNLAAKVTANAIGAWAVLHHVDTGRTAQVLGIHLHNSQNSCKKIILKVDGIHFIL